MENRELLVELICTCKKKIRYAIEKKQLDDFD